MRLRTFDRVSVHDRSNFYAPTQLGKTRYITPEGFLVIEGVCIARTGTQQYHVSELALKGDSTGVITVTRTPEEVFSPTTLASFEGKPITVEHPPEFVTPENWKKYEVGQLHNVRRGDGIEDDMMMADIIIKDAGAIAYVNRDKPEVSCGYDSDYIQTEPGFAQQTKIIGNHLALVDRGRAGPRCAIRDHSFTPVTPDITTELFIMSTKSKTVDRLLRAFAAFQNKDAAALEKELTTDSDGDEGTMDARLKDALDWIDAQRKAAKDAIDAKAVADAAAKAVADAAAAKKKEDDDKKAAADALLVAEPAPAAPDLGTLWTGDSLKDVLARAEILSPGIQVPTTDALKTNDAIPNLMLAAVKAAYGTEAGKASIDPFLMGAKLEALTKDSVIGVFTGGAELMRARNNLSAHPTRLVSKDFGKPITAEDWNKQNREFWATRGG